MLLEISAKKKQKEKYVRPFSELTKDLIGFINIENIT